MTQRNIALEPLNAQYIEDREVEFVERKGIGHPDSLCDGISESVSRALSKLYTEKTGSILHHNTDETHIVGGQAEPAFAGGKILRPATLALVGRATTQINGEKLPYKELVTKAATDYLATVVPDVDLSKTVTVQCLLGEGSVDLKGVFAQEGYLANDTSFGCGFAPFSETETLVLETEKFLTLRLAKTMKALGKDVKVMGCRRDGKIELTVAAALVGQHVKGKEEYINLIQEITSKVADNATHLTKREVKVSVNTGDNYKHNVFYLTVTGLSMENGDDGSTGRGNRANGLITPYRPMSMEAASGKNPVTHVGKIYNILANRIADDIVREAKGDVREVHVRILSQIGRSIDQPQVATVNLLPANGTNFEKVSKGAREVADRWLANASSVPSLLMAQKVTTF